ncbi:MAG: hypothetical protein IT373_32820 [Polyangiaceae bacterium]|nr:hypothetical protein [Polyangiaceae bacterium]
MGWKQYMREQERRESRGRAENEVAEYEAYLTALVSLHKDCGPTWNWAALRMAPPPVQPAAPQGAPPVQPGATHEREAAALAALARFAPGFFDSVLGKAKQQRAALEEAVTHARADDAAANQHNLGAYHRAHAAYAASLRQHDDYRREHALWTVRQPLAEGVLKRSPDAYRRAIEHAQSFRWLSHFQTRVATFAVSEDAEGVAVDLNLEDRDIVPREELKLTAGGKVSTKNMAAGRYWLLFQDHVCSCTLRAARELFAVLPVQRAIVNVRMDRLNPATGYDESVTIVAALFVRHVLHGLNMAQLDPSDSLRNFPHRMKFKKTAGFDAVEPITFDEQWVTT